MSGKNDGTNIGRNARGSPRRIIDLLTSNWGEWFSVEELIAEFDHRWPDTKEIAVRRALVRLHKCGHPDLEFAYQERPVDSERNPYRRALVARGRMPKHAEVP